MILVGHEELDGNDYDIETENFQPNHSNNISYIVLNENPRQVEMNPIENPYYGNDSANALGNMQSVKGKDGKSKFETVTVTNNVYYE